MNNYNWKNNKFSNTVLNHSQTWTMLNLKGKLPFNDEKMYHFCLFFACFFAPIGIQFRCFCCVFCYVFSTEKVHRDETLNLYTNLDFVAKQIGVKKCVCLCSWWSLTSQRYGGTYAFLMILCDEACLILKKLKIRAPVGFGSGKHKN